MSCAKDKSAYTFTRAQTTYLICLYEQQPVLYDVGSEHFKNKTRRQFALKKIQDEFNNKFLMVNVSLEDIRKKINSLRTQFFAEQNKVKKSMLSGAGAGDIYSPSLWCYEYLAFLNNSNPVRASESNLSIAKDIQENIHDDPSENLELLYEGTIDDFNEEQNVQMIEPGSEVESPLGSPPARPSTSTSFRSDESQPSKKRKRAQNIGKPEAVALMEKATRLLENVNEPIKFPAPLDVIDAFLGTVGAELRQIKNPIRCRNLRREILNLIYESQQEEELEDN